MTQSTKDECLSEKNNFELYSDVKHQGAPLRVIETTGCSRPGLVELYPLQFSPQTTRKNNLETVYLHIYVNQNGSFIVRVSIKVISFLL